MLGYLWGYLLAEFSDFLTLGLPSLTFVSFMQSKASCSLLFTVFMLS